VYSFALLFVPWWVAVTQAAAFEMTYIGLAVADDLGAEQRRRATAISVGAVAASIVYNTLAGWFHRQPELLIRADANAWLAFAVLHGAPLAWVAYLVADLLLHTRGGSHRPAQLRALVRRLARALRDLKKELAPLGAMLAQARADLEQARAQLAEALRTAAQQASEVALLTARAAQAESEAARLQQDHAHLLSEAAQLRASCAQQADLIVQRDATIAQLREQLAQAQAATAREYQARAQFESAADLLTQENAQLRRDAAQPIVIDGIDILHVARYLRSRGVPSRESPCFEALTRMREAGTAFA